MKTGVNTGTIINVNNSPIIKKANKKSEKREKRAQICIDCSRNDNGYCRAHKGWAGQVNYICLGIENPYKKKRVKSKNKKDLKYDKKIQKKAEKLTPKQIENLAKRYKIK